MNNSQLFENVIEFPDPNAEEIYKGLIGLDEIKSRLIKESEILLNPKILKDWSKSNHGSVVPVVKNFENRSALYIFAGDVGTGKTTLAETFGDSLAREKGLTIFLYKLSLSARGSGAVGEMTRLITGAFEDIKEKAKAIKPKDGIYKSAILLLIDEADALAQSRELDQMHHEDRAGVNALIRGVDSITKEHLPVITLMCTNRLNSLDPAVRRRAAITFEFSRPNFEQRKNLFIKSLQGINFTEEEFTTFAELTGENESRTYGYTFSDIAQKILPAIVLQAYPDKAINADDIVTLLKQMQPTPPFNQTI